MDTSISQLLGKTLVRAAQVQPDRIEFDADDGSKFVMFHSQDCCESVAVEDITGDLLDLVGTPILKAEESTNSDNPKGDESHTWTFYHLATIKGYVTIRWYGSSNGFYSESVDVVKL